MTTGAGSRALPVTPAGKEPMFFGLALALLAVEFAFSVLIITIIIIRPCCSKLPMGEIVYWKKKKPLHLQSGPFVQHEAVLPGPALPLFPQHDGSPTFTGYVYFFPVRDYLNDKLMQFQMLPERIKI